ncbi:Far1 [Hordeum vulgare]|nr:Far1 [Hordeum vulgare]
MEDLMLAVETAAREALVRLRDIIPEMADEPSTRHLPFVKDKVDGSWTLNPSSPIMVNGTTLTLEHVMRRVDVIENKVATIELIENLDKKIHNQITQYRSKVGMVLKNLKEKEPTLNKKLGYDSARIGKLEDVITNLGSAFAAVQNTPYFAHNKATKSIFIPKNSCESSSKKDEDLKMMSDHATYGLSTKDDDT